MKKLLGFTFFFLSIQTIDAVFQRVDTYQQDIESNNQTIVRNKIYFKTGKVELAALVGTTPYDSLLSTTQAGMRLSWHIDDNFGWEIIDLELPFSQINSYTQNLVVNPTGAGSQTALANLELILPKFYLASSFLFSPFYGKFKFFGSSVLFYDIYTSIGAGVSQLQTIQMSSPYPNPVYSQVVLQTSIAPLVEVGFGFKIFTSKSLGLLIDFRDYLSYATLYGSNAVVSHFTVMGGLSLFLPSF